MFTYRCTLVWFVHLFVEILGLGRSQVTKLWATSRYRRVASGVVMVLCGYLWFQFKGPSHLEPTSSRVALWALPAHMAASAVEHRAPGALSHDTASAVVPHPQSATCHDSGSFQV